MRFIFTKKSAIFFGEGRLIAPASIQLSPNEFPVERGPHQREITSAKSQARIIRERWPELIWRCGASSSTRNQSNARTNIVIVLRDDNDRVYVERRGTPGFVLARDHRIVTLYESNSAHAYLSNRGIGADFVRWLHNPRAIFCFARRNWLPSTAGENAPCRFNCFNGAGPPSRWGSDFHLSRISLPNRQKRAIGYYYISNPLSFRRMDPRACARV